MASTKSALVGKALVKHRALHGAPTKPAKKAAAPAKKGAAAKKGATKPKTKRVELCWECGKECGKDAPLTLCPTCKKYKLCQTTKDCTIKAHTVWCLAHPTPKMITEKRREEAAAKKAAGKKLAAVPAKKATAPAKKVAAKKAAPAVKAKSNGKAAPKKGGRSSSEEKHYSQVLGEKGPDFTGAAAAKEYAKVTKSKNEKVEAAKAQVTDAKTKIKGVLLKHDAPVPTAVLEQLKEKPKAVITGTTEDAATLATIVTKAIRKAGLIDKAAECSQHLYGITNYQEAMKIAGEYAQLV